MSIIVIDDERLALEYLIDIIKQIKPQEQIYAFQEIDDLLYFANRHSCNIAFLDIEMREMNGVVLAKKLKELHPKINIIFVTGYSEYMGDAFSLHTSGYLLKPVTRIDVEKEFQNLRYPSQILPRSKIRVQTFGNFEIFYENKPIHFNRSKSKEILAYLVDRRGATASLSEIAAILWEDGIYDRSRQKQMQIFISDLKKSLSVIKDTQLIIKSRLGIMIDTTKIDCDFYRFLEGDITTINTYMGEYMSNYSWAMFTTAYLDK